MECSRLQYIDKLKGFTILAVIMLHITVWPYGGISGHLDIIGSLMGSFIMPLFMFLSGFVVTKLGVNKKMLNRAVKLLCPMTVVGLLYVCVYGFPVESLFLDSMKKGYWYLWVLAIFYICSYSFTIPSNRSKYWDIIKDILVACLMWLFFFLLKIWLYADAKALISIDNVFSYWPFFVLGYFSRKYNMHKIIPKYNIFYTISLLGYTLFTVLYCKGYYHMFMVSGAFSIIVLMFIFQQREGKTLIFDKVLSILGKKSLDIYIYHWFFIRIIFLKEFGNWVYVTHNFFISFFVTLIIALVISSGCIVIGNLIRKSTFWGSLVYGNFVDKIIKF